MKNLFKILPILLFFTAPAFSQNCDIKIEILPEQYMYGTMTKVSKEVKKTEVEFKDNIMEVTMPLEGKYYRFVVLNENCQAYCKKQKRIRQLNSGDEKLVKNLLATREPEIIKQINKCGI